MTDNKISNNGKWTLRGLDPFDNSYYALEGSFSIREDAEKAAQDHLKFLEMIQPSSDSGGQKGMQDRVFIVSPEGIETRIFPEPDTWKYDLVDSTSFQELVERLEKITGSAEDALNTAIRILSDMQEYLNKNIVLSEKDAKNIGTYSREKKYHNIMSLLERIYKTQCCKLITKGKETLLRMILAEKYPDLLLKKSMIIVYGYPE